MDDDNRKPYEHTADGRGGKSIDSGDCHPGAQMAVERHTEKDVMQPRDGAADQAHARPHGKPYGGSDGDYRHLVFADAYERPPVGRSGSFSDKHEKPRYSSPRRSRSLGVNLHIHVFSMKSAVWKT